MRIKVIVPFPLDTSAVNLRRRQLSPQLVGSDTEVTFVPVRASGDWGDSCHDDLLVDFFVYAEGLGSETEGFDAVSVDTVSDAGLLALRSRLRIPAVGHGPASSLTAWPLVRGSSLL